MPERAERQPKPGLFPIDSGVTAIVRERMLGMNRNTDNTQLKLLLIHMRDHNPLLFRTVAEPLMNLDTSSNLEYVYGLGMSLGVTFTYEAIMESAKQKKIKVPRVKEIDFLIADEERSLLTIDFFKKGESLEEIQAETNAHLERFLPDEPNLKAALLDLISNGEIFSQPTLDQVGAYLKFAALGGATAMHLPMLHANRRNLLGHRMPESR